MTSVSLHLFDDTYSSPILSLYQTWESSANYVTVGFSEEFIAKSSRNINGISFDVTLKGSPVDFGRMPNYAAKKKSITEAKGYVLPFEHDPLYSSNFELDHLSYSVAMSSTMRGEKVSKAPYPFLIIGQLGPNQKEKFTRKQVEEWANKHLESWEYITIDLWSLRPLNDRQTHLKNAELQKQYENRTSKLPKDSDEPQPEDRLLKLSEEELKQLQEDQAQKLEAAMKNLIVKANQITLPEVKEEGSSSSDKLKKRSKKTQTTKIQGTEKKASSFTKFLQSILLLKN